MRFAWGIAFLVIMVGSAEAQRAKPKPKPPPPAEGAAILPLADVLATAVRVSPELELARIDLEVAKGAAMAAEGVEDFRLTLSGDYRREHREKQGGDMEADRDQTITAGSIGIARVLPTGGSLALIGSTTKVDSNTVGQDPYNDVESKIAVEWRQPLLRGLGPGAARADIYEARRRRDAATNRRAGRANDLVRDLIGAYWAVALAQRQLEVRKASLELADKQLEYTTAAIRTGKIAKSEQLAVEQVIATRKQDILSAELDLLDRSFELRRLAGLEIDGRATVVATAALPKIELADLEASAEVGKVMKASPELAALEADVRAARAAAAGTRSGLLPRADFTVNAGPLGNAQKVGESISRATKGEGYSVNANLTVEYALGHTSERGAHRIARAEVLRAEIQLRDGKARIAAATARAVQGARAAAERVALGDRAVELAGENVVAEQKRFEVGKTTNFEVLRRQDELQQAKLRQAQAVVDYLAARSALDALHGDLLAKFGITIR